MNFGHEIVTIGIEIVVVSNKISQKILPYKYNIFCVFIVKISSFENEKTRMILNVAIYIHYPMKRGKVFSRLS